MTSLRALLLVSVIVLTTAPAVVHAQDADFKCRQTINKEFTKYIKSLTKALQKCNDAFVASGNGQNAPGGDFSCGDVQSKFQTAFSKLNDKITKKCDDAGITPADIGWPPNCPDFEGRSESVCAYPFPVPNGDNMAVCLGFCTGRVAVVQAIDLYYRDLANPNGDAGVIKCQRAIGKEATKFLSAKQKALGKCRKAVDKMQTSLPCPDGKASAAITKADSKKVSNICKACGTTSTNGVTCNGGGFSPAQIGFVSGCPSVTVPFGGPACGGAIATLSDLVTCVDCITEFKVDCLDAISRPDQVGYPPECATPVTTPTPTATTGGGQTPTPTRTATVTPTATPGATCGNGMVEAGEDCDPPGSTAQCSALGAGNGNEVCSGTCTCTCPHHLTFTADPASPNTELDIGWTGISHDIALTSNMDVTAAVTCGGDDSRPCGTCTLTGPVANTNAGFGGLDSRRCRNDSSVQCTSNAQCPGTGNACVFWLGAPLPLGVGGVPLCWTHELNSITGTANVESGEMSAVTDVGSHLYQGIAVGKPCPQCTDAGALNDGVHTGTCTDGPRAGLSCDAMAQSPVPAYGRTSLDCPPGVGMLLTNIAEHLESSTDPETRSLSSASPNCTGFGFTADKCACDTCNNAAGTPCASNADCTAVGATVCGGLRCLNDSGGAIGTPCTTQGTNADPACGQVGAGACGGGGTCVAGPHVGSSCSADSDCGGTCGRPGEPTKPNQCVGNQCISGGGADDGQCQTGPDDHHCSIETFRGCISNSDCNPPVCPSCMSGQTCVLQRRECYFDLDEVPATHNGSITANGVEGAPSADTSQPTLAALYCVGASTTPAVNTVFGLPGLAKLKLTGTARLLP